MTTQRRALIIGSDIYDNSFYYMPYYTRLDNNIDINISMVEYWQNLQEVITLNELQFDVITIHNCESLIEYSNNDRLMLTISECLNNILKDNGVIIIKNIRLNDNINFSRSLMNFLEMIDFYNVGVIRFGSFEDISIIYSKQSLLENTCLLNYDNIHAIEVLSVLGQIQPGRWIRWNANYPAVQERDFIEFIKSRILGI